MATMIHHFLKQAAMHPRHTAVLDIQGAYTYEQLNHRSAYLAEQIRAQLSREGKQAARVALLCPMVLHGIYDLIASSNRQGTLTVFITFIVLMFLAAYFTIRNLSRRDRFF